MDKEVENNSDSQELNNIIKELERENEIKYIEIETKFLEEIKEL